MKLHCRVTGISLFVFLCALTGAIPIAHGHGDVHARIGKLTRDLAEHPADEILIRRARLYLEEGHAEEARRDLLKALELAPDRYESLYYLAQAELMLRQYSRAILSAEQFVASAQNDAAKARGLTLHGDCLMAAGKPLEAAHVYRDALNRAPEPDPEQYIKTADALHAAGESDSLDVLAQGIEKLGPIATLEERALAIETETGRHDAALRRVDRMLQTQQRVPFLLYKKGLILEALERPDESAWTLREALGKLEALPHTRRNTRAAQELRQSIERALGAPRSAGDEAGG